MRATLAREWTPREDAIATRIGNAVDDARGSTPGKVHGIVGAVEVGIAAGLGHRTLASRARAREIVYDLMPRAVELHPDLHRGRSLVVIQDGGTGIYYSTADAGLILRDVAGRVLGMRTQVDRMLAVTRPLSRSRRLAVVTMRSHLAQLDVALDPAVWDAIIAEVRSS